MHTFDAKDTKLMDTYTIIGGNQKVTTLKLMDSCSNLSFKNQGGELDTSKSVVDGSL